MVENAEPDATDAIATTATTDAVWVVWRQDDNGNRFEVARHGSRTEAEKLAATMEARGHRQLYWVAAG